MTNTEYLASNPSLSDAQGQFLLLSEALRDSIASKQDTLGVNHRISPVLLTDGRYGVCCDLLTEIGEGGIYHEIFTLIDLDALNTAERVDKSAFLSLLPTDEV